jgi:hypothetical protein
MKTNWLSDFLRRFGLARNGGSDVGGEASAMTDPEVVKQIVRGIVTTRSDEIGCDECFEQVDRFAEIVLEGRNAAQALPLVQDHLNRCIDCREEFEALVVALRALS